MNRLLRVHALIALERITHTTLQNARLGMQQRV